MGDGAEGEGQHDDVFKSYNPITLGILSFNEEKGGRKVNMLGEVYELSTRCRWSVFILYIAGAECAR